MSAEAAKLRELRERLKKLCGLESDEALESQALTLLAWAANEAFEGRAVGAYSESDRHFKEIDLLALENAAKADPEDVTGPKDFAH